MRKCSYFKATELLLSKLLLSNVLGQFTIFIKILEIFYPPRPLFNVESRLPQIMIAVDIQTSTPTLNWGGGRANFREGIIVDKHMKCETARVPTTFDSDCSLLCRRADGHSIGVCGTPL